MIKKNLPVPPAKRGRPLNETARSERIQLILGAAKQCFVLQGFHGASILDVAKTAQISVANIYQYFESKEALIVALALDDLQKDQKLIRALAESELEPEDFSRLMGQVFCSAEGLEKARMRMEILSEAARNNVIARLVRDYDKESMASVEVALQRLQDKNLISKKISPKDAANRICALYEGMTNRYVINHKLGKELMSSFSAAVNETLGLKG